MTPADNSRTAMGRCIRLAAAAAFALSASACEPSPDAGPSRPDHVYVLESDDRHQRLEVTGAGGDDIEVSIEVDLPCHRRESGLARKGPDLGDPEIEVDSFGDGYPVDVFELEAVGGCRIEVRLSAGDREYAWLREAECNHACDISPDAMTLR